MSGRLCSAAWALAFAAALPVTALAAGSVVSSAGTVDSYFGPLGAGIYNDGAQPVQDNGVTWFRDRATGQSASFGPTEAYDNYPWPAFDRTGTGALQLIGGAGTGSWMGTQGVDFWIQNGDTPPAPGDINTLAFLPNTSTGVVLDPTTHLSSFFKIATISFTNGTWFGSTPPIDPGNGPLYATSVFGVSLIALPDPQIGTPTFPWGGHQWNGGLTLTSTFGPNTPDYIGLSGLGSFPSGYFSVAEGATGTVELWGQLGSLLVLEYRNPVNGAIVSEIPTSPVPEPAAWLQMLAGLGLLAAGRRMLKGHRGLRRSGAGPR